MEGRDKHWLSPAFLAPNVMEVDTDPAIFAPAFDLVSQIQPIEKEGETLEFGGRLRFNVMSMTSVWASDILWISQDDLATYHFFDEMFRASGIGDHVAHRIAYDRELRLYSGFFVTRSRCDKADFHVDWLETNNQAFTFLMPLTANCREMGLSYQNARGQIAYYQYQLGKGLIFGDHFYHSTTSGHTDSRCVLLSFTFGTDKMENWPRIAGTAAAQGRVYCRPDGLLMRGHAALSDV